ncbi:SdrD B-like domain-containing protein, partial [Microbacterium sp. NPDC076911]|uniref:SdrD B-like domain-containing protein n=1 Tax=Microbacterium sp. NPDC076911 TaxID=3154958 RepID=UPI00343894B2
MSALAAFLALVLAIAGFATPAFAVDSTAIKVTLSSSGETYNGTPVLTAGSEYTLALQYDNTKLNDGDEIFIEVPEGITVPDSALVLPTGSSIFESFTREADGSLKLTVKSPRPSGVNQGILQLKFVFDEVNTSSEREVTWTVGGQPTTFEVVVKTPGDSFENVGNSRSKSASPSNLNSYITVTDGTVTLKDTVLTKDIAYTVKVNTTSALTDLGVTDTIDDAMTITANSFAATLTTWDDAGLNRETSPFAVSPSITATGFAATVTLPADSQFVLTYKARVTDKAALEARLQAEYDKVQAAGGSYSTTVKNTVAWSDGQNKTATVTLSGSVAAPPADPQPNYGSAFSKSVDVTTVDSSDSIVVADATPVDVVYTLSADLTKWADFSDTDYALARNVVIRDQLPTQASWSVDDAGFLTVVNAQNEAVTFAAATGLSGDYEAAIAADEYVGTYAINGQNLYVNIGKDTTQKYTVKAKATIENLDGLTPSAGPLTDTYSVRNYAFFIYGDGKYSSKNVTTKIIVGKDTSAGVDDEETFSKSVADEAITVPSSPETTAIPFTFTVKAGTADVTGIQIIDVVDLNVFDVSNLAAIEETISVSYGSLALDANDWNLSLNADDELVFEFTDAFTQKLTAAGKATDLALTVTVPLPLKGVIGKQTLQITNNARLIGTKVEVDYLSSVEMSASTYGDELEVRKTVYDEANSSFTNNLRVELDENGDPVSDEFVYRIDVIPHGAYGTVGVAITDIVDALPEQMSFIGFTDGVDGSVIDGTSLSLDGNLEANYADDVVTISQKANTVLNTDGSVVVYVKVALTEFKAEVSITNAIGDTSATITPTDGYPLKIRKVDSDDQTVVITDKSARFQVLDSEGTVVVDNIYVVNNSLVVADEDGADKAVTVDDPGKYTVKEITAPAGYKTTSDTVSMVVIEDIGSEQVTFYNEPIPLTYAVGDYTWIDENRDGVQDDDEPVLQGVVVNLLDGNGEPVLGAGNTALTTTTNADGLYVFDGLPAGDYQVEFALTDEQSATYVFTATGSGTALNDSDAEPAVDDRFTGRSETFTLGASNTQLVAADEYDGIAITATGGIDPTWDAGVVRKKVSVGDYVWLDVDRDGVQGTSDAETPIEGVKLVLTGPDGNPVVDIEGNEVAPVFTDEDGFYEFVNLPALPEGESYTVTIDQEDASTIDALTELRPTVTGAGDTATDSSEWTAASGDLTDNGDRDSTLDFGFMPRTYAIGDIVWIDANSDGEQDSDEHTL